jgi:tRNA 2-thiouridine synthesizing protein A
MTEPSETLDLKRLKCPLPALMAKKRLARARPGQSIAVIADDPLAHIDIPHMCREERYDVVEVVREGNATRLIMRRP